MVRPYKVRIYSAADPPCWSHRSSNAYIARCCCRSKPNENSQFPREPSNSKSVVLYKRRWDETLMLGERQRFITQKSQKSQFPDTDRKIIPNGTSSKSRFSHEFPPKRFDDCPSHFVNVRIFPYIRIVSILATLIYSCCLRLWLSHVSAAASNGGCFIIINRTRAGERKAEKKGL
jgi:hypothetical protein